MNSKRTRPCSRDGPERAAEIDPNSPKLICNLKWRFQNYAKKNTHTADENACNGG